MFKTLVVPLTLMLACTPNEKPQTPGGGAMSANIKSESPRDVQYVRSEDGTRIAFEKAGKGPALVVVGGALSDRSGGKPLVGKLMEHFTVYTYDRRGRGE